MGYEPAKEPKSPRFDHLIYELLDKNNGVFIGEYHNFPALRQALIKLAPAIKAHGVTTLSIEVPQSMIHSMVEAKSTEEWLKTPSAKSIPPHFRPEEICNLARAFHKVGIKVLGHEDGDESRLKEILIKTFNEEDAKSKKMGKNFGEEVKAIEEKYKNEKDGEIRRIAIREDLTKLTKDRIEDPLYLAALLKIAPDIEPASPENILHRNRWSAKYILDNHKAGKILVVGGKGHSQHSYDAPGSPMKPEEKEGLDKLLKIPSVNLKRIGIGEIGATQTIIPGQAYEMILPDDLKKMLKEQKINSWPPEKGIPKLPFDSKPGSPFNSLEPTIRPINKQRIPNCP